jgi:uncharacterized membrane protein
MKKLSTYAILKICLGVICILIGISRFVFSANYLLGAESLFLGLGVLLYGLENIFEVDSGKRKTLTYIGIVSIIIGVILLFYNTFFR